MTELATEKPIILRGRVKCATEAEMPLDLANRLYPDIA